MSNTESKGIFGELYLGEVKVTATADEINAVCDQSNSYVLVTDAASYSLLAANSGKTHILPDMTAACTISLPTEVAGLNYTLIYGGVALDAHGIVLTSGADANYFLGGVTHIDTDSDAAGDEVVSVYPDGNSNSKLTCSSVGAGTEIKVFCDGTKWYVSGLVVGATAPAFADQ